DQGPFLLDPRQAPAQELPKSAGMLDLTEDGFDDHLPPRIEAVAAPRRQLPLHTVLHGEIGRRPAPWRDGGRLRVLAPSRGDEYVDVLGFKCGDIAGGPIPSVG